MERLVWEPVGDGLGVKNSYCDLVQKKKFNSRFMLAVYSYTKTYKRR